MSDRQLLLPDVERAIRLRDPQLAELVIQYLDEDDPAPGRPEVEPPRSPDEAAPPPPAEDEWTLPRLRAALAPGKLQAMTGTEQKAARREAWEGLLASANPPPRLKLGKMLIELYEAGDEPARAALGRIFLEGRMRWGVWQAAKRIYKVAEERHDAELLGVLGYRFDALVTTRYDANEIGAGTILYMRRRVWRWLRHLGQAVPELYPDFVVQVLRHYPAHFSFSRSWVASQVWGHKRLIGQSGRAGLYSPPKSLDDRAFPDAWKASPAPLLRLLEDALSSEVCGFAIRALQKDFPDSLRRPEPAWLARLGGKRLEAVDEFIVEVLKSSPELHQSKLRGLGLHELVLGLLRSESGDARAYAIDYARAHAADMPIADLVALLEADASDVQKFARERLQAKSAKELGLAVLARMLDDRETKKWAEAKIKEAFRPADFAEASFDAFYQHDGRRELLVAFFASHKAPIPTAWLLALAARTESDDDAREAALEELGKRAGAEIGLDWAKRQLDRRETEDAIKEWVKRGLWKGEALDVEWLKGLVERPRHRRFALEALGNRELVPAPRLGLGWLLEMARRPDESVRTFASAALLEAFAPGDFAPGRALDEGIDRLFALAGGPKQPDVVRAFAATYLRVHHPDLNASMPEARQFVVQPKLAHEAFTIARVRPLLDDERPDVRRLGMALAKPEIVRWGDPAIVYGLAESGHADVRSFGCELLLGAGGEGGLEIEWLDADRVFALAESPHKAVRETALALLRRHYARLGSPERLGWLMESPERDVQLQAVRLLWERHRPRATGEWRPKKATAGVPLSSEPFDSDEAIAGFLRRLLFGLPPGRMERRDAAGREAAPGRPMPASVAKRRAIEIARDLAVEDVDFARMIAPVLGEFMASQAKGEWQACVAALARIRSAHPAVAELAAALPAPAPTPNARA